MKPSLPSLPWHGGCQCGAVRYEITGMPLTLYACHCTECQKQSASVHGLSMWVEAEAFHVEGDPVLFSRPTDSGSILDCYFCRDCGSRLWHASREPDSEFGDIISLKAGSLDDKSWIVPVAHIWTGSKQADVIIPDGVPKIAGDPVDDQVLIDAWRNWISGTG